MSEPPASAPAATPAAATLVPPRRSGVRGNALAEITAFIGLFVAADLLWFDGSGYWSWSPHPFWFIVVFVATQYGSREGLVAAALSCVALFAGYIPAQTLSQDFYAWLFELARLPLLWSVSAVLLGELRMRHIRERDGLREQVVEARERAGTIAAAYESLNETKSQLEVRVAGELRTVVSMYKAARAVETMEPAHVLTGALDNVKVVINPQKCSIYLLAAGELEAAIQHGWHRRDRFKRIFRADDPLYQAVIGGARVLCVANADDEGVLAGQGLIAGPLLNPDTGEVRGMIKIEDMGFLDLNLSTIEIFRVLCEWVGAFYANAQRYRRGQL
ncbi:MAG: GAF domain-containing protein, partial [Gammaproteobacteria bacterium]